LSGLRHDHPERPRARDRHPGVREAGEGSLGRGPAEDLREAPRDQAAHGPVLRGDHRDAGGAGEVICEHAGWGWADAHLLFGRMDHLEDRTMNEVIMLAREYERL